MVGLGSGLRRIDGGSWGAPGIASSQKLHHNREHSHSGASDLARRLLLIFFALLVKGSWMTNRPLLALMLCALLSFPLAAFAGGDQWMAEFEQAAEREDCPGMTRALAEGVNRNEASAVVMQGLLLLFGRCHPEDSRAAAEKFMKAASMDNPLAMLYYATLLDAGEGVKRDSQAAEFWGRRALCRDVADSIGRNQGTTVISATVEQPEAPVFLKRELERLTVVAASPAAVLEEADAAEARNDPGCACHWRWAGARGKEPVAMRELGLQLLEGRGVAVDTQQGWSWFVKAAQARDQIALVRGAEFLALGKYTSRRSVDAYAWLLIAQRTGADVDSKLDSLAATLNSAQMHVARRMAEHMPSTPSDSSKGKMPGAWRPTCYIRYDSQESQPQD